MNAEPNCWTDLAASNPELSEIVGLAREIVKEGGADEALLDLLNRAIREWERVHA